MKRCGPHYQLFGLHSEEVGGVVEVVVWVLAQWV